MQFKIVAMVLGLVCTFEFRLSEMPLSSPAWNNAVRYTQHQIIENDYRYISTQDLLPSSDRFTDKNVKSFSRLLFDVSRDQVIVGARPIATNTPLLQLHFQEPNHVTFFIDAPLFKDTIYRLSFSLKVREKVIWEATPSMMQMCQNKGQIEEDCRNFIMVLHNYENQLYVCGTYAFNPNCSWRQMENLNVVKYDTGVAKSPFSPHANITTLMTERGLLFVGLPTDFSGSDSAILRSDVAKESETRLLRTNQYNSNWLNNPQFVGSFEAGEFVFFIFRETAIEFINCGKVIYSRIARVCKSDPGGELILKDNWTSFLKARLNCSLPGEFPFYFNEVQGITYSSEEKVLYATFTTPENGIAGSAICAFNLSAINLAFDGPFKHQETLNSAWESVDTTHRAYSECKSRLGLGGLRHSQLLDSSRYQLMDKAVQSMTPQPLHLSHFERFVHIAVDMISTKLLDQVRVLYASTDDGIIKKLSVFTRSQRTCTLEIWRPESRPYSRIHTMQYLKETESLYIGTELSLMRISGQHCNRHVSISSCLNSMDPYCGWNELLEACTPPPNGDPLLKYWIQNATQCPILTAPVDGGWSSWSEWSTCVQSIFAADGDDFNGNVDKCLCKTRSCDNPSPKNGGKSCKGMNIAVTNCTVNGGWTEWSAWSACSQTCGVAIKTRRRTCGNPKPAHGGRVCIGPDGAEIYCTHLPPCPIPNQTTVDGGWGPWGAWSLCSTKCAGGIRIRRRECNNPEPQNGGLDCIGCNVEHDKCNNHPCPEVKKMSSWTPWSIQVNGTVFDDGYIEKRYKYSCRASTPDTNSLKINLAKEETRICSYDGTCQRVGEGRKKVEWSDWSSCNSTCGGGQQYRTRICKRSDCENLESKMARACNTHPCTEWSCWSDWSTCSVSCGIGQRRRTRKCFPPTKHCQGKSFEEELCEMPKCETFNGWSAWGPWSDCSPDGNRSRSRKCSISDPNPLDCQGKETEIQNCVPGIINEATYLSAGLSSVTVVAIVFITAMVCSILSVFLTWLFLMRKHSKNKQRSMPASSVFDTANQNQYISLPTKDQYLESRPKARRQSSFSSSVGYNDKNCADRHKVLRKSNNIACSHTPKVLSNSFVNCETGTLKRNSHGLNNSRPMRTNEDDKF